MTIKQGDNVLSIARMFGVTPQELAQANPGVTTYRPGVVLNIPGGGQAKVGANNAVTLLQKEFQAAYAQQTTGQMAYPEEGRYTQQYTPGYWRYGYEAELNYARQLNVTALNILQYDQWPEYMTPRMVSSFGMTPEELALHGYVKDGDYWIREDPIDDLTGAGSDGGGGGGGSQAFAGGRGGWGGGGGGWDGGGNYPDYTAGRTGLGAYSQTGRIFDPASMGMIYWRL